VRLVRPEFGRAALLARSGRLPAWARRGSTRFPSAT
jgi:hypothetical protein